MDRDAEALLEQNIASADSQQWREIDKSFRSKSVPIQPVPNDLSAIYDLLIYAKYSIFIYFGDFNNVVGVCQCHSYSTIWSRGLLRNKNLKRVLTFNYRGNFNTVPSRRLSALRYGYDHVLSKINLR